MVCEWRRWIRPTPSTPDSPVGVALVGDRPDHEWAGDPQVRDVVTGLVSDIDWQMPVGRLSGGQRRRVQLAALLIGDWDVIGLDEPTNHLDVEGITWLAAHLKQRWSRNSGGLLVVTHDRWFPRRVATTTWEVHDGTVEPFDGGYASYVLQRVERDRIAVAAEAKRQNLMRKELAWLRRGAPARTSKPKFRIEAANQLIADVPPIRNTVELARSWPPPGWAKTSSTCWTCRCPTGANRFCATSSGVSRRASAPGSSGANGAGKSTLLGLIAGTVTLTVVGSNAAKTVRLAMLDQQSGQLAGIADDLVREVVGRLQTSYVVDGKDLTPTQLLERLGFRREQLVPSW